MTNASPALSQPSPTPQANKPANVLLLASLFTLPYRVLRTIAASGPQVHVLGGAGTSGMVHSRLCASFEASRFPIDTADLAGLAQEINALIARRKIDMVLAGDQPATRTLIALKPLLNAPIFPSPSLELFDRLNDKWAFTQMCQELGILCPQSRIIDSKPALRAAIAAGEIALPLVAKPLSLDGNRGVVIAKQDSDIDEIEYSPILVQAFVEGQDIGASVYCENGDISAVIIHKLTRATYRTFPHDGIETDLEKICRATKATGVFNFDMRVAPDGQIYWFECNPRFFYKMDLSMLAGVNFVACGIDRAAILAAGGGTSTPRTMRLRPRNGANVRMLKALAATAPLPFRITSRDIAFARYVAADPVPYVRQALKIDWEDRSY